MDSELTFSLPLLEGFFYVYQVWPAPAASSIKRVAVILLAKPWTPPAVLAGAQVVLPAFH